MNVFAVLLPNSLFGHLALVVTATGLLASGASLAAAEGESKPRPNVVVILADDMGWSDLGCYGGEMRTPTLDGLAANGLRFTRFYNAGRCCPTRASLLTGLYPHQAGVGHMTERRGDLPGYQGELNRRCRTIAEVLRPAGYATYAVGKWHVARDTSPEGPKHDWPLQRGFDRFYGTIAGGGSFFDPATLTRDNTQVSPLADPEYQPETYYYTDAISEHAVRFVKDHDASRPDDPFFMYVAYTAAHWPMHALPEDIAEQRGRYDEGYEPIRAERFRRAKELGLLPEDAPLAPQVGDWDAVKNKVWEARCMEVYAAMIDSMDQGIGRIVEELKRTGRLDDTLILFMQDNGGCQEDVGRQAPDPKTIDARLPVIPRDALLGVVRPKQTRDGVPTRTGPDYLPGPPETYIAYGMNWANVSNTPFREYKHFVHEGGIATPLVAHWPNGIARPGSLEARPGHLIDVMATCVDLAAADYPSQIDGQAITPLEGISLAPAFAGNELVREAPIFWEHEGNRAIAEGDWKLVAKEDRPWELYDLSRDRSEGTNLAATQPDQVADLSAKWDAWAARADVLPLGGWRSPDSRMPERFSDKARFELKGDADLARTEAPDIAKRGFKVRVEIGARGTGGVLVAQGGTAHGWSLYYENQVIHFVVRRPDDRGGVGIGSFDLKNGSVVEIVVSKAGQATLIVDGDERGSSESGLVQAMPIDGLQVGRDAGGAVGDYDGPFAFDGTIESVTIELEKKP